METLELTQEQLQELISELSHRELMRNHSQSIEILTDTHTSQPRYTPQAQEIFDRLQEEFTEIINTHIEL